MTGNRSLARGGWEQNDESILDACVFILDRLGDGMGHRASVLAFFSSSNPGCRWISPGFCTEPYLTFAGFACCT